MAMRGECSNSVLLDILCKETFNRSMRLSSDLALLVGISYASVNKAMSGHRIPKTHWIRVTMIFSCTCLYNLGLIDNSYCLNPMG